MIRAIKLRLRARRLGRLREDALLTWWLDQIREASK